MPPAPLGARLCRMPAPCLTGRNGVFCRAPGRRRALRLPHISPQNGLFPLRQAAAQSMCAARRRPSLPAQTSLPHATASAAIPHVFPSANTPACILSPRSPAARSPRLPGCASPHASRFRNSFPRPSPSLPSLSFALRRALPRSSPRRSTRLAPLCFALLQQPPNLRPPRLVPGLCTPASRFSFFFSLLPSRARQSRPHHVSQTPRPGSPLPEGRRLPASLPDLSLQKSLLFHASPPLFEHN